MFNLKLYSLIFVVFILANVAGCGQTGDLYLLEDQLEDESKKDQSKKLNSNTE